MIQTFKCSQCKTVYPTGHETGYKLNNHQEPICYKCSATDDRNLMKKHKRITLYLDAHKLELRNFPGSLILKVDKMNITRKDNNQVIRTVWFNFDNQVWKGEQYGENQATYCSVFIQPRSGARALSIKVSPVQKLLRRFRKPLFYQAN